MTRQEALELIDRMPYITTIMAPNDKVRMEFYKEAMDKNSPIQWIKIIKTCYIRENEMSGKRKIISTQETYYGDKAKKLLYDDLAAALGIHENEVEGFINTYLADNL